VKPITIVLSAVIVIFTIFYSLSEPECKVTIEEPPIIPIELRYGFTDDDIYLLAQLLCGDASIDGDGEYDFVWSALHGRMNYYEMGKVLCVVMNRQRNGYWGDTVREVVLAKGQFVVFPKNLKTKPHDIAMERVRDWCYDYDRWDYRLQVIPESHLYFRAGPNLTNVTR